jgi:hypothetical protein
MGGGVSVSHTALQDSDLGSQAVSVDGEPRQIRRRLRMCITLLPAAERVGANAVALLAIVAGIGPALMVEKHFRPLFLRDWQRLRRRKATGAPADPAAAGLAAGTDEPETEDATSSVGGSSEPS